MIEEAKDFYTPADIARQLNCHTITIRRMIDRNDLPPLSFGDPRAKHGIKGWYKSDLDSFFQSKQSVTPRVSNAVAK